MTATAVQIDEPGVYDLPPEAYHADCVKGGSLSSSGAKKILPPSCPALFKAWRDRLHVERKQEWDFGRAAHREVLGAGDDFVVVDVDDWRTKSAREQRDQAYADGLTPVLASEYRQIKAMAAQLRAHPIASALLEPGSGRAEQTIVWQDDETGVMRRALLDWLPEPANGYQLICPDYKTASAVDPESIGKSVASYGYDLQAAWYLDAVTAVGYAGDREPAFVLISQMKVPPYLVTPSQVGPDEIARARRRIRKALHLYRWCTTNDEWPGYADDKVLPVELPGWATYQDDAAFERGDFDIKGIPA